MELSNHNASPGDQAFGAAAAYRARAAQLRVLIADGYDSAEAGGSLRCVSRAAGAWEAFGVAYTEAWEGQRQVRRRAHWGAWARTPRACLPPDEGMAELHQILGVKP